VFCIENLKNKLVFLLSFSYELNFTFF